MLTQPPEIPLQGVASFLLRGRTYWAGEGESELRLRTPWKVLDQWYATFFRVDSALWHSSLMLVWNQVLLLLPLYSTQVIHTCMLTQIDSCYQWQRLGANKSRNHFCHETRGGVKRGGDTRILVLHESVVVSGGREGVESSRRTQWIDNVDASMAPLTAPDSRSSISSQTNKDRPTSNMCILWRLSEWHSRTEADVTL